MVRFPDFFAKLGESRRVKRERSKRANNTANEFHEILPLGYRARIHREKQSTNSAGNEIGKGKPWKAISLYCRTNEYLWHGRVRESGRCEKPGDGDIGIAQLEDRESPSMISIYKPRARYRSAGLVFFRSTPP